MAVPVWRGLKMMISNISNSTMSSSFPNPLLLLSDNYSQPFDHTSLHLITFTFLFGLFLVILTQKTRSSPKQTPQLPPGPIPWPLLGNLPELLTKKPAFRWIFGLLEELNTEIACIKLGNVHVIPVNSPEIAREFFKKHDALFASRPITMASQYLSRGFLTTALSPWGKQWTKMKRIITSEVLKPARLKWLLQKRTEEADNLVRFIYNQCKLSSSTADNLIDSSVVNVRNAVRQYTGNVIRKMMFSRRYFGGGRKDGGPGVEEEELVSSLFTALGYLFAFSPCDYLPSLRLFDIGGHEKIVKEAINTINKYHDPIINERIIQWRKEKKTEVEDILDVFITMKNSKGEPLLSVEEIKGQVTELMLATVDNPAHAVEWAMAEMINQPEIIHKAVEEIDRVVGKERLVQESDIPELKYVKAVAREAMRLHPTAPFNIPHVSMSDAVVAGYFIPKGSHVLLSRVGLGRNPRVWEEPLRYKPERHMNEDVVELSEPELRFISFSTGRRGCPGIALGTAMTVMLLARLLQGFSWSVPGNREEIDLKESIDDLFLAKPLHIRAEPRLHASLYPN